MSMNQTRAENFINLMCQPPLLHGDDSHKAWLVQELRKYIPVLKAVLDTIDPQES